MSENQLTIGLLAHVDAGKTTLAEAILYLTGSIRSLGRVDHQDAYLDTFALERSRGITIFSKQALVKTGDLMLTMLDTPGHVDFSAEMERTLQVLDYAVLLISGTDGVQSHVETLWRLLKRYNIPTFLFVNKMDLAERASGPSEDGGPSERHAALMEELTGKLDAGCVDFTQEADSEKFQESLAVCDEGLLEAYLAGEKITEDKIRDLIASRKVFPCYFGSALKLSGVEEFLGGIRKYTKQPERPGVFGARVYKISRDAQGNRLTHLKVTGGTLHVKDALLKDEKVNQIRIYSGAEYEAVPEAPAGTICAVTGLTRTHAGEGLGAETEAELPLLEPVLSYRIELPGGLDEHTAFQDLKQLEEEEPELHISWEEASGEIHAQLMGEVQTEVLQEMIRERFGYGVRFKEGSIVYRETITSPVVGIGHFEPLRHYAEVHLLLEPAERGSGLQFDSVCSEDDLAGNWQRLILTHLEEKQHPGVLTGSEITDLKITLVAGRAHEKHTEGGDFRQATYRAVRQGLMQADSVLLEPYYSFRLEVPAEETGRALSDITRMYGKAEAPENDGDFSVITGKAPVVTMRGYPAQVASYTKGRGHISCSLAGYEPCHNAQEVIDSIGYDAQADKENPCGSVFCAHGAGFVVPWEEVPSYAHIKGTESYAEMAENLPQDPENCAGNVRRAQDNSPEVHERPDRRAAEAEDEELRAIFERTYGPKGEDKKRGSGWAGYEKPPAVKASGKKKAAQDTRKELLIVDGYNIIFSWEELNELSKENLEAARGRLLDLMSDYQGYRQIPLLVVFDAYKVPEHGTEVLRYHNIYVAYTKTDETADQYIEKTVREIAADYRVTVATSDNLEQITVLGGGASRISGKDLYEELAAMHEDLKKNYLDVTPKGGKTYFFDGKEKPDQS